MAGFIASLAAPLILGVAQNILGQAAGAAGAGGPGGTLFSLFGDAFKNLLTQIAKNPLQSALVGPLPALFSTGEMSPQVLDNPTSYLEPAMPRMQEAAEVMSSAYGSGYSDAVVRDHRGSSGGVSVRDHRIHPRQTYYYSRTSTSGFTDKYAAIAALQQEKEELENAAINDPKNGGKQLRAQEAAHAYQLFFAKLLANQDKDSELQMKAIQSSNLRVG
jgi:hypothetical protein